MLTSSFWFVGGGMFHVFGGGPLPERSHAGKLLVGHFESIGVRRDTTINLRVFLRCRFYELGHGRFNRLFCSFRERGLCRPALTPVMKGR